MKHGPDLAGKRVWIAEALASDVLKLVEEQDDFAIVRACKALRDRERGSERSRWILLGVGELERDLDVGAEVFSCAIGDGRAQCV